MVAEGIDVDFQLVLADAVFSENALLSIGEGTPYVALLDRVPQAPLKSDTLQEQPHLNNETGIEDSRHAHRLRAVFVSPMLEAFAGRHCNMINHIGPSLLPGERLALGLGDQVELYRNTSKYRPAWIGPVEVRVAHTEHGIVTVRWQCRVIDIPLESVRRYGLPDIVWRHALQHAPGTPAQFLRHGQGYVGWYTKQKCIVWMDTTCKRCSSRG